jgi:UDP:flavonoid glycosyltransferase YjiC (YdhE family)
MIAIFESLKALDIEVKMVTHGGPYTFILEKRNIPFEIIQPKVSDAFCMRYMRSIYDGGRTQNYTYDELLSHVKSEIDYFKNSKASVIVSGFTLSARLSSSACDIALVVTHLGSWTPITFERYGVEVRECFKNAYTRFIPGKWLNGFGSWLFPRIKSYLKVFNEVSVALKIERCKSMFDLLMGDHTLITDVPEILGISEKEVTNWRPRNNKQYRATARLAYSGPIFAHLFGEIPKEVLDILNCDKPKIYISMNSGPQKYLQEVYKAIANMDVVVVMVSTLHKNIWGSSSNVIIRPFLPSDKVMSLCDLAIIHGGQGTIQTAIESGVPMIGFPLQPEQNFNLRRIADLGAGKCMALYDLKPEKLKAAIEEILNTPSYSCKAKELKVLQSKRDGPESTAKYIKELLTKKEIGN